MKVLPWLCAALVSAAVLVASDVGKAEEGVSDIKIALSSSNMGLAPVRYAQTTGLFKKHGINAELITMDSGNATMAAIISGSAQFGGPGLSEAVIARARGQKIVIVANVIRGLSMEMVVSKAVADRSGASASSSLSARLKGLQGINVALPSATSPSVAAFRGAASAAGVTFNNVYMAQTSMVAALEAGAIDAMVAGPPYWLSPVNNGRGFIWLSAPRGDIPNQYNTASSACLQATEEYAKANPKIVAGVRAAMVEFAEIATKYPERIEAWFAKTYPQMDEASIKLIVAELTPAWTYPLIQSSDISKEVEILKSAGIVVPGIDKVDPRSLVEF